MTRMCASLGIAVFLSACDNSPSLPTAPTSMPSALTSPPGSPPPGSIHTIFGVIRTGNVPVSGARVAVLDQNYFAPVTTDGDGRYSIRASSAQPWGMSPLVAASKPGYFADIKFTDTTYQPISKDTQLDFELDPLVQISVGEVVRGRVGGATCSHWGYGGNRSCSRFALTAANLWNLRGHGFGPDARLRRRHCQTRRDICSLQSRLDPSFTRQDSRGRWIHLPNPTHGSLAPRVRGDRGSTVNLRSAAGTS